jgi:3-oxoacyl-[acyl-carrier protein] reductase
MTASHDLGWVLVAGGSGGVGGAVCRSLADDGWHVALTYHRNADAAQRVASEIRATGRQSRVAQLDLRDASATAEAVRTLAPETLAGVVYAAGPMITMGYISAMDPATFEEQLMTDAVACFNLLQPSIAPLRITRGTMLAVVTPAINRYSKRDLLSSAPKAAVQAVVRGIAAEEGRNGIRANCLGVGLLQGDGMWPHVGGAWRLHR